MRAVLQSVDDVYTGAHSVEPSSRYTSLAHLPGFDTVTRDDLAYFAALVCCAELLHEQTDASLSQLLVAPVSMSDCLLTGSSVCFDCFPTCCQGPPLICLFGCAQGWVCLQMDSYSFNFPNDGDEILRVQLVPLLDLINHGDDPNIALSRDQDSSSYVATALRPIR